MLDVTAVAIVCAFAVRAHAKDLSVSLTGDVQETVGKLADEFAIILRQQKHDPTNKLVDSSAASLFDMSFKVSPLERVDLQNLTFATIGCAKLRPILPLRTRLSRRGTQANHAQAIPAMTADALVEPVFATFQLFFLAPFPAMVFAPNATVTRALMQSPLVPTIAAVLFLMELVAGTIVDYSSPAGVFDSELWQAEASKLLTEAVKDTASMRAFASARPHYLGQDWLHVCAWDLIGATVIYRDGLERQVPTRHSVLLCQVLGPVGWLSHAITSSIWQAVRGDKAAPLACDENTTK